MPYSKSTHRKDFETRINELTRECKLADKLPSNAIKEMVFQCAIFQTSAALEVYLKLLIESWAFALKTHNKGHCLPPLPRGFITFSRLQKHFARYAFTSNEAELLENIPREYTSWPTFDPAFPLPTHFDGKIFHARTAYPSFKNLKRLFFRVGITNFQPQMQKLLKSDIETLVENFQSIRTALAHSSPPHLTLADVKKNIRDMENLVSGIDRVFYKHVISYGGSICWT